MFQDMHTIAKRDYHDVIRSLQFVPSENSCNELFSTPKGGLNLDIVTLALCFKKSDGLKDVYPVLMLNVKALDTFAKQAAEDKAITILVNAHRDREGQSLPPLGSKYIAHLSNAQCLADRIACEAEHSSVRSVLPNAIRKYRLPRQRGSYPFCPSFPQSLTSVEKRLRDKSLLDEV